MLPDEIHILNLAVTLDWRGLGLGQKLVGAAIREAYRSKVKQVFLEVRATNIGARSLYKKLGFQEKEHKKRYYSNGDDAVPMTLPLFLLDA